MTSAVATATSQARVVDVAWVALGRSARCSACDIDVSSQGDDPAGRPCSRCGVPLVAKECGHPDSRLRELRPRRSDPSVRRAQCDVRGCNIIHVWLEPDQEVH
jgi:hypothetical protein